MFIYNWTVIFVTCYLWNYMKPEFVREDNLVSLTGKKILFNDTEGSLRNRENFPLCMRLIQTQVIWSRVNVIVYTQLIYLDQLQTARFISNQLHKHHAIVQYLRLYEMILNCNYDATSFKFYHIMHKAFFFSKK